MVPRKETMVGDYGAFESGFVVVVCRPRVGRCDIGSCADIDRKCSGSEGSKPDFCLETSDHS